MTPPSQMVDHVGRLTISWHLTLYLAGSIMSVILGVFNTWNVKRTTNMIQYMSGVPPPEDVDCGDRPCNDDLHCGDFYICKDGILVVGGKTSAGPSTEITLLSANQGWCSQSGFPDLPHPLVNPGFPGDFPCTSTSRGWDSWSAISSLPNQTDYKMTYSALEGSIIMISKDADSNTYRLQPSTC